MAKLTPEEIRNIAKEIFKIHKKKKDMVAKFLAGKTIRHVWESLEPHRAVRLGNRNFDTYTVMNENYVSVFIAPDINSNEIFIDIGDFPVELAFTIEQTNDIIRILKEAVIYAKEVEKEISKSELQ